MSARTPRGILETTKMRVAGVGIGRPLRVPPSLALVPRITLTRVEPAAALGMSLDSFERHVQPELRLVRRGSIRLVPVAELIRASRRSRRPRNSCGICRDRYVRYVERELPRMLGTFKVRRETAEGE